MAVISSTIVEDQTQVDGRRTIRERHIDHVGKEHIVSYIAEAATDVNAKMAARVSGINDTIKSQERQAALEHVLDGKPLGSFGWVDIVPLNGRRWVFKQVEQYAGDLHDIKDYCERQVTAGAATLETRLGITNAAAIGVVAWAQGIVDAVNNWDTARTDAALALSEIG